MRPRLPAISLMDHWKTIKARRVFMILSPRSLAYARHALQSLLENALEPLHLHLITDSTADKDLLSKEVDSYRVEGRHRCDVLAKADLDDQEAALFGRYPGLRFLRNGHPCWRKITDPVLLSGDGDEMVLLDPDLYFPNRFCFEATPDRRLLLMWQRPSCLPAAIVNTAIAKGIALAHHVDIGVAHWRAPVDLDWLEWLVRQLEIEDYPDARFNMHIEAIVWAALAMRIGGGYLEPEHWHCWRRSQLVRVLRRAGVPGPELLRTEPFARIKCFHGGGEAKHWLAVARERGWLDTNNVLDKSAGTLPFVEFTRSAYNRDQALKAWLRKLGYYSLFPSGAVQ